MVIVYADSDGQRYIGYDLMSVLDIGDAVERMQDFGIGTMTVPYNTLQNGKIGIGALTATALQNTGFKVA